MSGEAAAMVGEAVAASPSDTDVIAGHSGAGLLLPSILDSLSTPVRPRPVFVDAALPDCEGEARLNPAAIEALRPLAVDGVLPPWSTWWGAGGVEQLIPDRQMRARVEAELLELPMTLFESTLPVAVGWCDWLCDYLLLSEDMRGESERARSLRWTVEEDLGNHMDVVNRPDEVAAHLVRMAG